MITRLTGWFLAVLSFGFACVHMGWALGWRWGVPDRVAPIEERPWFLAYNVVAGLLMYAAAAVALLLVWSGLPSRLRDLLTTATLVGSGLALARGVPGLIIDVATSTYDGVSAGADAWFTVVGLTGLTLVYLTRLSSPREPDSGDRKRGSSTTRPPGRRPPGSWADD